ncbi:hypothetical protein M0813_00753 [Anaeramoeba flamelloides]|uniref:Uncharacterized protein n=1 Tax=Anaeramoeba flamelloides TaxID=1746091 RepID=A0ABQ8XNC8_9EUKA|nr:hypothetical protein M0813_00753 [Anaeramoeba flamelloides]
MNCGFKSNIRKRSSREREITLEKDLISIKQRKTNTNQGIAFSFESSLGTTDQNAKDVNQEYKAQKYDQEQKEPNERGQIALQTLTSPSSPISDRSIGCVSPIINHFYENNQDKNEDGIEYEDEDEDEDQEDVLSLDFLVSLLKDENKENDPILKYFNEPKEEEETTNSNSDYDSDYDGFDYGSGSEYDSDSDYDSKSDSGDEKKSKIEQDQEEKSRINKLESELESLSSEINELNYQTNESKNENLRLNKELEELLYFLTNQEEHPSTLLQCSHDQQLVDESRSQNLFEQKIEDQSNPNENTNLFIEMSRNI